MYICTSFVSLGCCSWDWSMLCRRWATSHWINSGATLGRDSVCVCVRAHACVCQGYQQHSRESICKRQSGIHFQRTHTPVDKSSPLRIFERCFEIEPCDYRSGMNEMCVHLLSQNVFGSKKEPVGAHPKWYRFENQWFLLLLLLWREPCWWGRLSWAQTTQQLRVLFLSSLQMCCLSVLGLF